MKLNRKKADFLKKSLNLWVQEKELSESEAKRLADTLEVPPFDWKRLARYSFWISLICAVIAIGAIVTDQWLVTLLETLFQSPAWVKCLLAAALSGVLYREADCRSKAKPQNRFSNQALLFLAVLLTGGAVFFLGQAINTGSGHFSILLLFSFIIYGLLALHYRSTLVWVFAILSLGSWFGTETGYESGWGAYFLGMNYPLRFVVFGLILTGASFLFSRWKDHLEFQKPTFILGLLNLFIALWMLSIFGNYGDMDSWQRVKQYELLGWSLLFGLGSLGAIAYGLKRDDSVARGFGITFLFINLYTRFFEYCWDSIHKAIFFAILAASFWALGTKAEKIWNLGKIQVTKNIK